MLFVIMIHTLHRPRWAAGAVLISLIGDDGGWFSASFIPCGAVACFENFFKPCLLMALTHQRHWSRPNVLDIKLFCVAWVLLSLEMRISLSWHNPSSWWLSCMIVLMRGGYLNPNGPSAYYYLSFSQDYPNVSSWLVCGANYGGFRQCASKY